MDYCQTALCVEKTEAKDACGDSQGTMHGSWESPGKRLWQLYLTVDLNGCQWLPMVAMHVYTDTKCIYKLVCMHISLL